MKVNRIGRTLWARLSGHLENGGRARAGKRPVSEYGPGARREQPGEVPGLPHQRVLPAESCHDFL